ncbi:unnamed protein product [Alopecurus aequalis]
MDTDEAASGIRTPPRQRRHFLNHLTAGLVLKLDQQAPATMASRQLLRLVAAAFAPVLLLCRPAGATEHAVGGDGVSAWDTGSNYAAWAQAQSFAAGDVLVFNYVKSQHNVYEVTEAAYRTCDATAPGAVLAMYDSGFDKIALPEANKTYYYICQIPNHCIGGMKLAVKVSGAAAGDTVGSPAVGAPPAPSAAAAARSWTAWTVLVVLGVALALVN